MTAGSPGDFSPVRSFSCVPRFRRLMFRPVLAKDRKMSSWINNGTHDAKWFWDANAKGASRCMNSKSSNSYVGRYDNDEASSIQVCTDGNAC